ncbi:hypothetical protein EST38_g2751 [Candolleomyces aberdarensis]|uniref:Cytochrome P450 n=1 Tax=Candolleomyces aberdarensis TaxID=2316362 RepID=A0A4Q2DVC1_9AGAR|nr:hypothetical protein EST38_g2751 [Candolleomyces aberdarensis]
MLYFSPFQILASILVGLLILRLLRGFVLAHPLDCIPGPPSQSLLKDPFPKHMEELREPLVFSSGNKAVFGDGLLSTLGNQHRKQRKMLNPVFSPAHMRTMTSQFFGVTYKLRDVFLRKTSNGPQEVEAMTWLARTAFEIVAQSGFGTSFDPISEDYSEHRFVKSTKLLGPVIRGMILLRLYIVPKIYEYKLGTPRFWRTLVNILPWNRLHKLRDIVDTMYDTSFELFNEKKKALVNDEAAFKTNRKDLMSVLSSTFTFAAMDTTSSALCRIFWLLSTHQDVQDKLRSEIREVKQGCSSEEPDYDKLSSMPYLDAVCRETLRLYAPISLLAREARQDAVLPLSRPIETIDGRKIQEIHIPKNTKVFASLLGSNTTPELWGPDTYEWKPERWLAPLPEKLVDAHIPGIYSHLMTFIGGSRSCIGFKFSQMEMKAILYVLIDQFKFFPTKQEIFWNSIGISTPSVDRTQLRPEMPLLIARAD